MFLKVNLVNTGMYPETLTINTDQITYYFKFKENTTMIHFPDNTGIEAYITEEKLDDILVYKNCDPTPIKEINDHIDTEVSPGERLATPKQQAYVRSIAKKKGLDLQLPKIITASFAREFLDKYTGSKPIDKFDTRKFFKDLDGDADGEFPGYK